MPAMPVFRSLRYAIVLEDGVREVIEVTSPLHEGAIVKIKGRDWMVTEVAGTVREGEPLSARAVLAESTRY
jgi:hypothetical protein